MKSVGLGLAVASLGFLGGVTQPAAAPEPKGHHESAIAVRLVTAAVANPAKVDATKAVLRDLWIGHVFWVRNVVIAGLAGEAAAEEAAEKQVVANAKLIAAAIEPFYGTPAEEKLFGLLAGHYGAVKAYFDASVAKNSKHQGEAITKLTRNADELATFLSGANPNLPKEALMGLLQAHAGHHIAQIQELEAKDYDGEAKTWADMSHHMYVIADALADGLAKQFPAKF